MLKKINDPILFQGKLNKKHYFEGWYYKQISKDEKCIISFIPGISLTKRNSHCFVQYIFADLRNKMKSFKTGYIKYPISQFKFSDDPFKISIGENIFSKSDVVVKIEDEQIKIDGKLHLGPFTCIEKSLLMPNIMGFFAYIPNMQCYHGIMSMNHKIDGTLLVNNEEIDFDGGKGYIEKDWGTSFPQEYIWIQCNSFKSSTSSLSISVAKVPFMNKYFRGFLCNLSIGNKEYRFATYNSSKMKVESFSSNSVRLIFHNGSITLRVEAYMNQGGDLIAPDGGRMKKIIKEEPIGKVKIYLYDKWKDILYEDEGEFAGIEIVGFNKKSMV